jgi:hypothetical protein
MLNERPQGNNSSIQNLINEMTFTQASKHASIGTPEQGRESHLWTVFMYNTEEHKEDQNKFSLRQQSRGTQITS